MYRRVRARVCVWHTYVYQSTPQSDRHLSSALRERKSSNHPYDYSSWKKGKIAKLDRKKGGDRLGKYQYPTLSEEGEKAG